MRPVDRPGRFRSSRGGVEQPGDRSCGCVKSVGMVVTRRPMSFSVSTATPVLPRQSSLSGGVMPDQRPSSQSALFGL